MTQIARRHRARTLTVALALAALLAAPGRAAAAPGDKVDGALRLLLADTRVGLAPVRVIVTASPGQLSSLLLRLRLGAVGVRIVSEHPLIEAVTIEAPRLVVTTLLTLGAVRAVALDARLSALADATADTTGARLRGSVGLAATPYSGAGVGIAVIDSGIHPSPALQGRISAFYDFTATGQAVARSPFDDYGHGTHVAGLAAGSSVPSGGAYAGIAPGARVVGLKVLDASGGGYTSHVIAALEFAVRNSATLGIHVVNLSLGHPVYDGAALDPLVRAVEVASARGLVVVASAGNYGLGADGQPAYAGVTSPGTAPSAITIGAIDARDSVRLDDDAVAPYSSRGPTWLDGTSKPDVAAPGHRLTAAANPSSRLWTSYPALRAAAAGPGDYLRLSGTSMSAAVVSGTVALVLEAHRSAGPGRPALSPNAVKAILQHTALPLAGNPSRSRDEVLAVGAGVLNASGATTLAARIDTRAPLGTPWISGALTPLTTIAGRAWPWAQQIIWGNRLVWGDAIYWRLPFTGSTAWGSHLVWGDHIVWGDNTVWGLDRSWGNHIVWGDSFVGRVDGGHIVWGDSTFAERDVAWGNTAASSATPVNPLGTGR